MHSMTQQDSARRRRRRRARRHSSRRGAGPARSAARRPRAFPTTTPGYRQLLDWLSGFGEIDVVAIESTGSYAAGLVRYLREHDVAVVEVNQPHAHTRRRVGKSDPIDAEMAARLLQAGKAKAVPKQTDGIVESIRLLRVARDSAVKSRSAALVQVRDLIITAPQELRDQLAAARRSAARSPSAPTSRPSGRDLRCRPGREVRAAIDRATHRSARRRDRRPRPPARAARRDRRAAHRSSCSASRPATPASCSSPPARTSTASAAKSSFADALRRQPDPRLLRQDHPPPPQLRRRPPSQPRAAPDRRLPPALLPAHPRLRRNAAPPKARPSARSCAASSATSPARSTTPSTPTSPTLDQPRHRTLTDHHHLRQPRLRNHPHTALDIYRNVPSKRRWRLRTILGSNVPSRSRGASIATCPCSPTSVLGLVPLRVFPAPPGGS